MAEEIQSLRKFTALANSIVKNSKGERLLTALKVGLPKPRAKAAKKAIIFTESRRTQEYIRSILRKFTATRAKSCFSTAQTPTRSPRRSIRNG